MPSKKSAIEIYKFGGASLGDAAAFKRAADIVKACTSALVTVCSAPAGVTDLLLQVAAQGKAGADPQARERVAAAIDNLRTRYRGIAHACVARGPDRKALDGLIDESLRELDAIANGLMVLRELTPRTSDLVVSRGERIGARLFCAALHAAGVNAVFVDALDVVVTRGPYGGAAPDLDRTDAQATKVLRPLLAAGKIPVVPGFLGAWTRPHEAETGLVTLGRGGSDLTATLLGRALGALRVSLWKDVPGLLTADPRVVTDARVIPQLNVREAAELAYYGAKVLHPRALIPVTGKSIPVHVRPFLDAASLGTEISTRHTLDEYPVKALSSAGGQALVTIAGRGLIGVPGVAARAFAMLSRHGLSVSLITQASSEQSICFTVPEKEARPAQEALHEEFAEEIRRREVDGILVQGGMAMVAVVGLGMAGTPGIAARVFSALAAGGINLVAIAQGSSELNISFVVAAAQAPDAMRRIHAAFQLAKIGGGAASGSKRVDVALLGFGQIGRTLAGLIARKKGGVPIRVVAVIDRSGFVFDAKGLAGARVTDLAALKTAGKSFAQAPSGHKATPAEALDFLAKHALSRPLLVDLTAGETTPLVRQAIGAGFDVVMANKRPLSGPKAQVDDLRAWADQHKVRLRFEATVGAGLPILDTYRKLVDSGDRVLKIEGCVSGTLGYLMTAISHGRAFSEALREAMARGFTEPDPRDDLSGADVGRKALILGRLLRFPGEPEDVAVESLVSTEARALGKDEFLERLPTWDVDWRRRVDAARAKGAVLRYVASVTSKKISVGLRVVAMGTPFAALEGTDNQIAFTTTRYRSPLVITGAGAGPAVTAGGVLNDILELAE